MNNSWTYKGLHASNVLSLPLAISIAKSRRIVILASLVIIEFGNAKTADLRPED